MNRLTNENQLKEQKISNLQADLKSVLQNRKKLNSIEETMLKLSGVNQIESSLNNQLDVNQNDQKPNLLKETSMNINSNNKSLKTTMKNTYNQLTQSDQQQSFQNSQKTKIEEIPQWYINLKMKNSGSNKQN